jgi:GT2 family glycosyltransferase/protoporphyrinogen oxidase
MPSIVILGAGIAGLSTGWLLKQKGIDFVLLEKRSYAGGLARSFEWHGFNCDFAAHRLFTTDEVILQQLLNLVPMGRQIRRSHIYLRGHWMRDPLDVLELAQKLSMRDRIKVTYSYLLRPRDLADLNFEQYVLRRYGRQLYEYFFRPYTEKLFGIPGRQISVLWARQKVRLANPLDTLRENTKTKFQYFYYPLRGGYGAIVNRLYADIQDRVFLDATVTELEAIQGRISALTYLQDGKLHRLEIDTVISTLPLSITTRMLGYAFDFNYQKVDAVYLLVNQPLVSDDHWVYFIDQDISINRMVEFKNMSPIDAPAETTVLCAEVTRHLPDPIATVIEDLEKTGLVNPEDILDAKVIREEFAYPVYSDQYEKLLEAAGKILSNYQNLYIVGRAAEFQHREADDNFAAAIATVEKIMQEAPGFIVPPKEQVIMETTAPQIFSVILAYNNYSDTAECLLSLFAADYPHLRVVLVDNGSEDHTPEKVRQEFPQVHLIENGQNLGVPAGYNIGFRYALEQGADYILMLNNDTLIAPDMITKLLEQAESDPNAGIIMPIVLYYGSKDEIWSGGGRYRRFPPAILFNDRRKKKLQEEVRLIEYAPSCGLLIHRRAFERVGLFDPGYFFLFDDWDFSERVRTHGLNIWFVREAVMWHKVSKTTKGPSSPLYWYTVGASTTRYFRRHGRPAWISLPVHLSYIILREFIWKGNWNFWPNFWKGVQEGLQKPLGNFPTIR